MMNAYSLTKAAIVPAARRRLVGATSRLPFHTSSRLPFPSSDSAVVDLFLHFANLPDCGGVDSRGPHLTPRGVEELLRSIGERPSPEKLRRLFDSADADGDGLLQLSEFRRASDLVLAGAPARIVWVIGGPGSGKGLLCDRLARECDAAHLSSGDLLREEVAAGTRIGREAAEVMARGKLVESVVITALVRKKVREHPGRRVLLDGFPRSLENAEDFAEQCGRPEMALQVHCRDTVMIRRILKRAEETGNERSDDNVQTALKRIDAYHRAERPVMEWLREHSVPIIRLDSSGTPVSVWNQLLAIGRLMRPAAGHPKSVKK